MTIFDQKKITFLTPNPNEQAHSHVLARSFFFKSNYFFREAKSSKICQH